MSGNWSGFSLNGCRFENKPSAAPTLKAPTTRLPDRVDLRVHCSPIENQLKTNSCVANAVIGALEFHHLKSGRALTDLSRLFVYYNARKLSDSTHLDQGSFIHHGMAATLAYGACEAAMWPFDESLVTTQPNEACYQNARNYEAVQYARTPRGVPAMTALAHGLPVVFGIFVPGEYYDAAAQGGRMPRPDQVVPQRPPSGHAMLIVGYDMTERAYLVRNSWSAGWAEQGYCWIPFETMDAWSMEEDFWAIGAIEEAKGFSLMGPSLNDSMKGVGVSSDLLEARAQKLDALRSGLRGQLSGNLDAAKRDFRDRLRGK
ncbi:cysteine protease, papain family [Hyphomonas neptunium ATCC 15444]|uniref:Cysteine protease, papain family n=2 Tax=Hyphomonas TaxID=85 RepID=Q0C1P8_HYPNA|nr:MULTISPECIES: C1 family peptidase [Hyphomonas]ABI77219.1 cysteine protease, papain family [Hyphomonas neptunium ATCC 15444]KCZ92571.1 cysteine protease [Hyphomonas hirschiana VP5]